MILLTIENISALYQKSTLNNAHKKYNNINRKSSKISISVESFIAKWIEKLYYVKKMKQKNIKSWGEKEYKKLITE